MEYSTLALVLTSFVHASDIQHMYKLNIPSFLELIFSKMDNPLLLKFYSVVVIGYMDTVSKFGDKIPTLRQVSRPLEKEFFTGKD